MTQVKVQQPYQEQVNFTWKEGTISWTASSNPQGMTSEEAREFAKKLLEAAEELDRVNSGIK
jgi:hypothetical protein